MSLIIDALKRAQQLRLDGCEGSPILNYPSPRRKRGRRSKKHWIPVGAGLISLFILLFVFLRPASSPLATQTNRALIPIERTPSVPVAEKISTEPPEKVPSLPKDEDSLPTGQALNRTGSGEAVNHTDPGQTPNRNATGQAVNQVSSNAEAAVSDPSSHPPREKKSAATKASFAGKKGGASSRQEPPSLSIAARKEETSPKSIGIEQEGGKSGALALDVLNHFNSGVTFYNQKEFSKAIQAYQKVIELDPTYVEAYNNLGIIYQMMGDVDRAFGAYQKSTEINPRYEKGYNNLGILLLFKGRDEEALEAFQKALAINPNNIESHINLGILFKNKGQWDEAIASYQKALAINPLHKETHYNIALLYEQLEKWELAISHYQQFIRLSSKSHPELVSRVRRHLNGLIEATKNKGQ